jgi:hypothetical protein
MICTGQGESPLALSHPLAPCDAVALAGVATAGTGRGRPGHRDRDWHWYAASADQAAQWPAGPGGPAGCSPAIVPFR